MTAFEEKRRAKVSKFERRKKQRLRGIKMNKILRHTHSPTHNIVHTGKHTMYAHDVGILGVF